MAGQLKIEIDKRNKGTHIDTNLVRLFEGVTCDGDGNAEGETIT